MPHDAHTLSTQSAGEPVSPDMLATLSSSFLQQEHADKNHPPSNATEAMWDGLSFSEAS
jgi:hypothetical protein